MLAQSVSAADQKSGRVACSAKFKGGAETVEHHHNPNLVSFTDTVICFDGYVSNFDGNDDDDGDGIPDLLGIPQFVVYRIDRTRAAPESRKRPTKWLTIPSLADADLAPTNDSYLFSQKWRRTHPDWYERGHLAQKYLLERLGPKGGWFSHNVVNAVPQRGRFNKTAWLDLECRTGAWANEFGTVWVVAGPVFVSGSPKEWLKDPARSAMSVAIPDELFKVVIRKVGSRYETLGFVMPQQDDSYKTRDWDLASWLVSVNRIENLTGLSFLSAAGETDKQHAAKRSWPVHKTDFDSGCKSFAKDDP